MNPPPDWLLPALAGSLLVAAAGVVQKHGIRARASAGSTTGACCAAGAASA